AYVRNEGNKKYNKYKDGTLCKGMRQTRMLREGCGYVSNMVRGDSHCSLLVLLNSTGDSWLRA
ncbi:hypothetical protein Tco_0065409, partial [Tanacetum coccineum]